MNFGEDLSLKLMQANKSYLQYLFRALKEIDIHQHYQLILLIYRAGGRTTQKHICDTLQIEKSNIVAVIALLEGKNYIRKEVNYKDRRGKLISLTTKANYLIGIMNSLFTVFEEQVADDLTWQEMYTCLRVLGKVNEKLKNMAIADAGFEKMMKQLALLDTDAVLS